MKDILPLLVIAAILIILIFYFATAKGEKKKIQLVNSENSTIDLEVEIADSIATRTKGLMGRQTLGKNEGMLFVFGKQEKHGFWMMNTSIPLDAIHISADGTIVDIIEMQPCGLNCPIYNPRAESLYVLEVNQGFSKENKIQVNKSRLILKNA